jgi:hypothetical protein
MAKIIEEAPQGYRSRCNHCNRLIEYKHNEIRKKKMYGAGVSFGTAYVVGCPGCHEHMKVNKELGLNEQGVDGRNIVPLHVSDIPYEDKK